MSAARKIIRDLGNGQVLYRGANGLVYATAAAPPQDAQLGLPRSVPQGVQWRHFAQYSAADRVRQWAESAKPGARLHVRFGDPVVLRMLAMRVGQTLLSRGGFGRVAWAAASRAPAEFDRHWTLLQRPPRTLLLELSARVVGRPGTPRAGYVQQLLDAYETEGRTLVLLGPAVAPEFEDLLWAVRGLMPAEVDL